MVIYGFEKKSSSTSAYTYKVLRRAVSVCITLQIMCSFNSITVQFNNLALAFSTETTIRHTHTHGYRHRLSTSKLNLGVDPHDISSNLLASSWSLPFFHTASHPLTYADGNSIPPLNTDAATTFIRDYFLPTSSPELTQKTIEQAAAASAKATPGTIINSADFIRFDNVMPGASSSPSSTSTTQIYKSVIDKDELVGIARQFDIFMRRIPQIAFLYALLDFFVLRTAQDVISDELEDDRVAVAQEWTAGAVTRFGTLVALSVLLVVGENLFYHPI